MCARGIGKVFGPITGGNLFWLTSLNVEEVVLAAVNRKSGSHILK